MSEDDNRPEKDPTGHTTPVATERNSPVEGITSVPPGEAQWWSATTVGLEGYFASARDSNAADRVPSVFAAAARFGVQPDVNVRSDGILIRFSLEQLAGNSINTADLRSAVTEAASDPGLAQ